jgi:PiT family inorganic phosphate transporter
VGSLLGVNLLLFGWDGINWSTLGVIVLSWVLSPVLAGCATYLGIYCLHAFLLKGSAKSVRRRLPFHVAWGVSFILVLFSYVFARQRSLLDQVGLFEVIVCLCVLFFSMALLLRWLIRYWQKGYSKKNNLGVVNVFKKLQVGAACAVAFGNGANDVSNSISPLLAVFWMLSYGQLVGGEVPLWILCVGGAGIVCGILMLGHRVMDTLGRKITILTPDRGFVIDLSVAVIVLIASCLGLPISTTHATTGSIIGAGMGKLGGGVRLGILAKIFIAWVLTVPFAALITMGVYQLLSLMEV